MHPPASPDRPTSIALARLTSPDQAPERAGPDRPRLLIVEDDPRSGTALERLFRRLGWDVTVSTTVAEALELLSEPPDCLILDLNLPDGDGAAVLAAIRDSGLSTRVVVASGTWDRDHLARVARLQPERLLVKPVVLDEIFQAFGIAG